MATMLKFGFWYVNLDHVVEAEESSHTRTVDLHTDAYDDQISLVVKLQGEQYDAWKSLDFADIARRASRFTWLTVGGGQKLHLDQVATIFHVVDHIEDIDCLDVSMAGYQRSFGRWELSHLIPELDALCLNVTPAVALSA
jgi:hypothetical protein